MKKVLFFSHSQALGGAELSLLEVMARLDRSRFESVMLAIGEGALSAKAVSLGAKVLRFPVPPGLADWKRDADISPAVLGAAATSVVRLVAPFRRLLPAVVYTHSQKAHLLGGLAGRMAGMPVVWHAREIFEHRDLKKAGSGLYRCIPDRILCVSQAVARQYSGLRGKVRVVPNGIDADMVRRLAGRRRGRQKDPGSPLVGMASRIAPGKGQHVFIEAASYIAAAHPTARFLIVGGPLFGEEGYLQKLRQQAESLGLENKVIFTGHLVNPLPAMSELNVLVHCPVVPEGFGRSVAEAMALGVPVVSVRSGGIPELIDDGASGLLAEPGDLRGLATAVVRLLSDKALAGRMAMAAREKIENRFTMEAAMAAVERTLLEV